MPKPVKPEAGAAQTAAPRQTVETAAEAGLPITQPENEPEQEQPVPPADNAPEQEQATDEAQPSRGIDVEACSRFHENMSAEDFDTVLEIVLAEAHRRGIVTTDEETEEPEDEEDEPEAEAEHAEARELLARYGLKHAWQDAEGNYHFDENAALKAAGGNADLLTLILPDNG